MHVYIFIYLICIFKLYIHTNTYNMLFFFFKVFLSSQVQHPPQRCLLFETPPLWRVWLKLLLLKIVLFEMVHLQAPAKWVWNLLHLMRTVTHTTAYASLCSLSEAAWCLLISAKPCVGFFFLCHHLLSIVFTRCYLIMCLKILYHFSPLEDFALEILHSASSVHHIACCVCVGPWLSSFTSEIQNRRLRAFQFWL